jgi:RNA exonuclease 4
MVVSVPSSQSSSSSYDVDEHDVGDVDIVDKSRYLAIDCEMVGIGPCGRTSRLARVAVLNYDGDVVYDVHVQVAERVTDHRTYVSGILPEDLLEDNGAVPFDEARHAVLSMMRGKVIVGHGLKNDLMALGIWDHPWHDVRDTARYVPFMRRTHHDEYNPTNATHLPKKLKTLARDKLNMEIQAEDAPHSPIEDALAALLLYRRHRTKWESAIRYKVERTREISCQGSLNETI